MNYGLFWNEEIQQYEILPKAMMAHVMPGPPGEHVVSKNCWCEPVCTYLDERTRCSTWEHQNVEKVTHQ